MQRGSIQLVRSRSLPTLIEEEIERLILHGEYDLGDRIHEKQLAERLGVSRGPLREALRSLESSGLIEQIPNRGAFVRRLTAEQAAEIYEVRAYLFALAGRLLAARATDQEIATMRAHIDAMDNAIRREDLDVYVKTNFALHEFIITQAGNSVLASQYLALVKQLRLCRTRSLSQGDSMRVSNEEHCEMVESIAARDPDRAQAAHMNHVLTAKLRLISSLDHDTTLQSAGAA